MTSVKLINHSSSTADWNNYMAKKIAMLFPYAPSYREAIYKLMDKELDVDWFFCGNAKRNLKLFDYSLLKHCDLSME